MTKDTSAAARVEAELQWPSFALSRGTSVNGYRIERLLGSGGFGITYLATDLLGQQFAIKEYYPRQFAARRDMTVQPSTAEDRLLFDECKARFLREAHALVRLGRIAGATDGIVRVQTYFEAFGTGFLVMDYVAGESLAAVLQRAPEGLPLPRVRSLLTQLLASVRIVHQAGLVHRDIKPANIILRENERLVLIDFGATRLAAPADTTSYTQIYSGGYAPPEQMLGLRQAEFSDIYAIGAVCYRAIGGSVVNSLARQNSLAAGRPDPLISAAMMGAARYPRPLLAAIDAALAVDPAQRPASADAMLALLGPQETPPIGPLVPSAATHSDHRRFAWLGAGVVGLLALAGVGYLLIPRPAEPPVIVEAHAPAPEPSAAAPAPPASKREEPPREAMAPVAPALSPAPVVSPLDQAAHLASSLSCAALSVTQSGDFVRVFGFAKAGQTLNDLLAKARDAGRVLDAVSRIDRFACAPLAVLGPLVRRTWDIASPGLVLRLEQGSVAVGGRLAISVAASQPALYLDLYQPDGSVRHLLQPTQSGTTARKTVEWNATPPTGQRLLVAISAAGAFEPAPRPESEPAGDYLESLRGRVGDPAASAQADLAMLMVRAAEPGASKQPARPTSGRLAKCANIMSRVQMGETLSNAEVTALQNDCRS